MTTSSYTTDVVSTVYSQSTSISYSVSKITFGLTSKTTHTSTVWASTTTYDLHGGDGAVYSTYTATIYSWHWDVTVWKPVSTQSIPFTHVTNVPVRTTTNHIPTQTVMAIAEVRQQDPSKAEGTGPGDAGPPKNDSAPPPPAPAPPPSNSESQVLLKPTDPSPSASASPAVSMDMIISTGSTAQLIAVLSPTQGPDSEGPGPADDAVKTIYSTQQIPAASGAAGICSWASLYSLPPICALWRVLRPRL